jgi:hypothetical protein
MTKQEADKLSQKPLPIPNKDDAKATKKKKKQKIEKKKNTPTSTAKKAPSHKKKQKNSPDNKKTAPKDSKRQDTKVDTETSGKKEPKKKNPKKSKATPSPRPDRPEKKSGGLSVVRDADPKSDTQDKITKTRNPTQDTKKAVPVAGVSSDSSRPSSKKNLKQNQVKLASSNQSPTTTKSPASKPIQFSFVKSPLHRHPPKLHKLHHLNCRRQRQSLTTLSLLPPQGFYKLPKLPKPRNRSF